MDAFVYLRWCTTWPLLCRLSPPGFVETMMAMMAMIPSQTCHCRSYCLRRRLLYGWVDLLLKHCLAQNHSGTPTQSLGKYDRWKEGVLKKHLNKRNWWLYPLLYNFAALHPLIPMKSLLISLATVELNQAGHCCSFVCCRCWCGLLWLLSLSLSSLLLLVHRPSPPPCEDRWCSSRPIVRQSLCQQCLDLWLTRWVRVRVLVQRWWRKWKFFFLERCCCSCTPPL